MRRRRAKPETPRPAERKTKVGLALGEDNAHRLRVHAAHLKVYPGAVVDDLVDRHLPHYRRPHGVGELARLSPDPRQGEGHAPPEVA